MRATLWLPEGRQVTPFSKACRPRRWSIKTRLTPFFAPVHMELDVKMRKQRSVDQGAGWRPRAGPDRQRRPFANGGFGPSIEEEATA